MEVVQDFQIFVELFCNNFNIYKTVNYLADILEIRKQRGDSVANLSRITKIPKDRIYKWESGVGNPKADDSKKLQDWLNNVEEVQVRELPWQIIDRLSKGSENMTEANLLLARKISSDVSGSAYSPFQQEGISSRKDIEELHLSGKIKPAVGEVKKAGRKGILKPERR